MNRNRLITMVFAVLASLGLAFAMAAPAQAADAEIDTAVPRDYSSYSKDCIERDQGKACVQAYGDILWIRDMKKDGHGLQLHWQDLNGDRWGWCSGGGVDQGWLACNKNFPEGHTISWRLMYYDSNGDARWTSYQYTEV
jgi:hypothetical protein